MTREETGKLIEKYFEVEQPNLTGGNYEHRLDPYATKLLYSMVRQYRPTSVLEFGISRGGSAKAIIKALKKNAQPFQFIGAEKDTNMLMEAGKNIFDDCGVTPMLVGAVEDYLPYIPELDFLFVDPDWDLEIAKWWVANLLPKVKKGKIVHIHDWSVNENLEYEGGDFPGIKYLIELFKEDKLPLKKIISTWDFTEMHPGTASSYWVKL